IVPAESNRIRASPLESNTASKLGSLRYSPAGSIALECAAALPVRLVVWVVSVIGQTASCSAALIGWLPAPLDNAVAGKQTECDGDGVFHDAASRPPPIAIPRAIYLSIHIAGSA